MINIVSTKPNGTKVSFEVVLENQKDFNTKKNGLYIQSDGQGYEHEIRYTVYSDKNDTYGKSVKISDRYRINNKGEIKMGYELLRTLNYDQYTTMSVDVDETPLFLELVQKINDSITSKVPTFHAELEVEAIKMDKKIQKTKEVSEIINMLLKL